MSDATFLIQDDVDATKKLKFQLASVTTGNTRTLTIGNTSGIIAVTNNIVLAGELTTNGWAIQYTSGVPTLVAGSSGIVVTNVGDATNKPLIVRGMAAQSGDLQQWQNSSNVMLAKVSSAIHSAFCYGVREELAAELQRRGFGGGA